MKKLMLAVFAFAVLMLNVLATESVIVCKTLTDGFKTVLDEHNGEYKWYGSYPIQTEGEFSSSYTSARSGFDYFVVVNQVGKERLLRADPLPTVITGLSTDELVLIDSKASEVFRVHLETIGSVVTYQNDIAGPSGFVEAKWHTGTVTIDGQMVYVNVRYKATTRYPAIQLTWGTRATFGQVGNETERFDCPPPVAKQKMKVWVTKQTYVTVSGAKQTDLAQYVVDISGVNGPVRLTGLPGLLERQYGKGTDLTNIGLYRNGINITTGSNVLKPGELGDFYQITVDGDGTVLKLSDADCKDGKVILSLQTDVRSGIMGQYSWKLKTHRAPYEVKAVMVDTGEAVDVEIVPSVGSTLIVETSGALTIGEDPGPNPQSAEVAPGAVNVTVFAGKVWASVESQQFQTLGLKFTGSSVDAIKDRRYRVWIGSKQIAEGYFLGKTGSKSIISSVVVSVSQSQSFKVTVDVSEEAHDGDTISVAYNDLAPEDTTSFGLTGGMVIRAVSNGVPVAGHTFTVRKSNPGTGGGGGGPVEQIGTVSVTHSVYDPGSSQTRQVGTKKYRCSGVKATIGSLENGLFDHITFTQNGTATPADLENVVVVVNGVEHVTTILGAQNTIGARYTAQFTNNVLVVTGNSVDAYIECDLKSSSAGKTVRMDIVESTDIRFVGQTSGKEMLVQALTVQSGAGSTSSYFTGGVPWFSGSTLTVEPAVVRPPTPPPTPQLVVETIPTPEVEKITYYAGENLWCMVSFKTSVVSKVNRVEWTIPGTHMYFDDTLNVFWNSDRTGVAFKLLTLPEEFREKTLTELRGFMEGVQVTIGLYNLHY